MENGEDSEEMSGYEERRCDEKKSNREMILRETLKDRRYG